MVKMDLTLSERKDNRVSLKLAILKVLKEDGGWMMGRDIREEVNSMGLVNNSSQRFYRMLTDLYTCGNIERERLYEHLNLHRYRFIHGSINKQGIYHSGQW